MLNGSTQYPPRFYNGHGSSYLAEWESAQVNDTPMVAITGDLNF